MNIQEYKAEAVRKKRDAWLAEWLAKEEAQENLAHTVREAFERDFPTLEVDDVEILHPDVVGVEPNLLGFEPYYYRVWFTDETLTKYLLTGPVKDTYKGPYPIFRLEDCVPEPTPIKESVGKVWKWARRFRR